MKEALSDCLLVKDRKHGSVPLDFAMIFIKSQAEMKEQFPKFARRLATAGMLWVSWPKKASGMVTDLNENDVRRLGLLAGLVDVKVCAVDEVWSGLKFVIRVKDSNICLNANDLMRCPKLAPILHLFYLPRPYNRVA